MDEITRPSQARKHRKRHGVEVHSDDDKRELFSTSIHRRSSSGSSSGSISTLHRDKSLDLATSRSSPTLNSDSDSTLEQSQPLAPKQRSSTRYSFRNPPSTAPIYKKTLHPQDEELGISHRHIASSRMGSHQSKRTLGTKRKAIRESIEMDDERPSKSNKGSGTLFVNEGDDSSETVDDAPVLTEHRNDCEVDGAMCTSIDDHRHYPNFAARHRSVISDSQKEDGHILTSDDDITQHDDNVAVQDSLEAKSTSTHIDDLGEISEETRDICTETDEQAAGVNIRSAVSRCGNEGSSNYTVTALTTVPSEKAELSCTTCINDKEEVAGSRNAAALHCTDDLNICQNDFGDSHTQFTVNNGTERKHELGASDNVQTSRKRDQLQTQALQALGLQSNIEEEKGNGECAQSLPSSQPQKLPAGKEHCASDKSYSISSANGSCYSQLQTGGTINDGLKSTQTSHEIKIETDVQTDIEMACTTSAHGSCQPQTEAVNSSIDCQAIAKVDSVSDAYLDGLIQTKPSAETVKRPTRQVRYIEPFDVFTRRPGEQYFKHLADSLYLGPLEDLMMSSDDLDGSDKSMTLAMNCYTCEEEKVEYGFQAAASGKAKKINNSHYGGNDEVSEYSKKDVKDEDRGEQNEVGGNGCKDHRGLKDGDYCKEWVLASRKFSSTQAHFITRPLLQKTQGGNQPIATYSRKVRRTQETQHLVKHQPAPLHVEQDRDNGLPFTMPSSSSYLRNIALASVKDGLRIRSKKQRKVNAHSFQIHEDTSNEQSSPSRPPAIQSFDEVDQENVSFGSDGQADEPTSSALGLFSSELNDSTTLEDDISVPLDSDETQDPTTAGEQQGGPDSQHGVSSRPKIPHVVPEDSRSQNHLLRT